MDLHRHAAGVTGWILLLGSIGFFQAGSAQQARIPPEVFAGLAKEEFAERERAQSQLVDWARKLPAKAITILLDQSATADDPEVRSRCRAALRTIVLEQEYKSAGFLGIGMQQMDPIELPDGLGKVGAIRITQILRGGGAERANLAEGGLIVGLGDKLWKEREMMGEFSDQIRLLKPGTVVTLKLLEAGKLISKEVKLGERPDPEFNRDGADLAEAVEASHEKFFRQWLNKRGKQAR